MRSSVELVCVDPRRVHEIWLYVSPLLKTACRRTALTAFADIEADILAGRSLLWIAWNGLAIEAAATTVLINSEIGKVCVITACGGRGMKRWLPLARQIENYARNEDCVCVRIFGRRGWLRALEGYTQRYVVMDKEVQRPLPQHMPSSSVARAQKQTSCGPAASRPNRESPSTTDLD